MMTKIMAINSGSSSLKFKLFIMPEETVITEGIVERIGSVDAVFSFKYAGEKNSRTTTIKDHQQAVQLVLDTLIKQEIIKSYDEIAGVGHRISHGGTYYQDATLIDETVEAHIDELSTLSPLHNPVNLIGIQSFEKVLPTAKQVAIFDTSFHHTIPEKNYMYALPYRYYEEYGIRRYGFHGPSHQYVSEKAISLNPATHKMITCHIGSGASIAAILEGKSINTSMGFTPLSGLVMGTRTGDIDPQIIPFIQEKEGLDAQGIKDLLNKKSGLLGLSGISNDCRDIEEAASSGNSRAQLALDVFAHQIIHYIGAYAADLNGLDTLVFTAGVGEHSARVRKMVCDSLTYLGVKIDESKNQDNALSLESADSKVKVMVIPTDEEVIIARDVMRVARLAK
ncbi:acetate kinase [Enterococcus faecium]|uniref:acetate/propionate family kinase n=1 Tax=Enterococcus TaxID=1350 RepID=UPI000CF257DB|nr:MULTISPECIES: acetate kinase [Enterococcus]EGP4965706.1 acetate kinase [Enterococcus faecium]EGP5666968.1 acetate kinase [Enterococcus faecium]EGW0027105.1 acetate kinase [Enterococcus faecium]MDG4590828.1 acetate kinase [Enterococcus faecium]PQE64404.1 acetate kinase [Enterococcus faecium]